ncbi:S41 family peptidase [Magnetospira thiophila]
MSPNDDRVPDFRHNQGMMPRTFAVIARSVLGLGLFLAGCAPATLAPPEAPSARTLPGDGLPVLARPAMTHTVTAVYEAITDKFIEDVDPARLALDGLQGLGAIDPVLVARRQDGFLQINAGAVTLVRLTEPEAEDVGGWARLSIDAIDAARRGSPDLRDASSESIYEALFDSALSQLDVYSRYAGAEQARVQRARREGFGGIGVRYQATGTRVRITQVLPDGPADQAGLMPESQILEIDGVGVANLTRAQVQNMLRGPINSRIALRLLPPNHHKAVTFELVRRRIVPASVFHQGTSEGIVVLRISSFNQHTTRTLRTMIHEQREKMGAAFKGLVLDLRGNPGGLLRQAVDVADLFLERGDIVRTRGRHPDSFQVYEAESGDILEGLPLALVIDGKSASAAEILAAALQDQGRAAIIGTTSYGKGTVQTVIRLPNDGEMTLTWSKFVAPSGYVLHGLGVRPVLCTSLNGKLLDLTDSDLARQADAGRASLAAWRAAPRDAKALRGDLRAACPAERRRDRSDLILARRVLVDRPLYAHLVDPAPASSVAEHK